MNAQPWHKTFAGLLLVTLLFPLAGLAMLWTVFPRGWAYRSAATVVILLFGVIHTVFSLAGLVWLGWLEPGGGMTRFYVKTADTEAHFSALEEQRAAQQPAGAAAGGEAAKPAAVPYWTGFLGPLRNPVYQESGVVFEWDSVDLEPLWKQPSGGGYASFACGNGAAFTIEQRRDMETVAAYDIETGAELWTAEWPARFDEFMGGPGPRATPLWHGGKVYALGATGVLARIDAETGAVEWKANILEDNGADNIEWGMAASPLIVNGNVITVPGGRNGNTVVAYNAETGGRAWSALSDGIEYSSPQSSAILGQEFIVLITKQRVVGLPPDGGEPVWDYPWETPSAINIPQPVFIGEDRMFLSTGYGYGCEMVKFGLDGESIVTETLWRNNSMKNKMASSVYHDGYIYGLDEAVLACLDAETGERMWKGGRYGHGQLILADGVLIVLTERGEAVLVRAEPGAHEEIAKAQVIEGKTWNPPAMQDGYLLVRNASEMACLKLGTRQTLSLGIPSR